MINILIADDHKMFVDGVKLILQENPDFKVCGDAKNGHEVVYHLQQQDVDVLLLDIDMPQKDGEETVQTIKKLQPELKILVVTMHDQPSYINNFMDLGVNGYVLKNTDKHELQRAITSVYSGQEYYSRDVLSKLITSRETTIDTLDGRSKMPPLSERELQIVKLTALGKSIPQISDELFISINTVKSHRKNIMRKLEVNNATGITLFAAENGLIY